MPHDTILVVDDDLQNRVFLDALLKPRYTVWCADSASAALDLLLAGARPDLILLDVLMPGMDGYQFLQQLQALPALRTIPVIFTTGADTPEDEERGLRLGAVDFIAKPLQPAVLLARVQVHLDHQHAQQRLRFDKARLEQTLVARQHDHEQLQEAAFRSLTRLAQLRDTETGNHLLRTQAVVEHLARRARALPRFAAELDERAIAFIAKSAPLHDIGKVAVPDRILLKPGPLDDDERRVMQHHARIGADAIDRALADLRQPAPLLQYAREVALHHHECWDGSGYPDQLAGDAIPLPARLMAVADVFDALAHRRAYKAPLSYAQVRETMAADRGRRFDPDLIDCFLADFDAFWRISMEHPDPADAEPVAAPALA